MSDPMLKIDGLNAHYGHFQALYDVDISVDEGEVLAIIGANGAGKTTLMQSIAGLISNDAEQIRYRDQSIGVLRADQVAGLGISLVARGQTAVSLIVGRREPFDRRTGWQTGPLESRGRFQTVSDSRGAKISAVNLPVRWTAANGSHWSRSYGQS